MIRQHICYLEIWGKPDGAVITLDGKRVGTLPSVSLWVLPGEVSLEASAPKFARMKRTVSVPEQGPVREHVELRPEEPQEVAPPAPAPPPAVASRDARVPAAAPPLVAAEPATAPASDAEDRGRGLRITGVALGVAGLAATGAGVAFGMAAKSAGAANAQTGAVFSGSTYDAGHRDQTLQYVGSAAGGALIVGGVTMWLVGSEKRSGGPVISLAPSEGGGEILAALTF